MEDFKTFGEACIELIRSWGEKDDRDYSFNAVSTVGDVFKTNSKAEFLQFVQGL